MQIIFVGCITNPILCSTSIYSLYAKVIHFNEMHPISAYNKFFSFFSVYVKVFITITTGISKNSLFSWKTMHKTLLASKFLLSYHLLIFIQGFLSHKFSFQCKSFHFMCKLSITVIWFFCLFCFCLTRCTLLCSGWVRLVYLEFWPLKQRVYPSAINFTFNLHIISHAHTRTLTLFSFRGHRSWVGILCSLFCVVCNHGFLFYSHKYGNSSHPKNLWIQNGSKIVTRNNNKDPLSGDRCPYKRPNEIPWIILCDHFSTILCSHVFGVGKKIPLLISFAWVSLFARWFCFPSVHTVNSVCTIFFLHAFSPNNLCHIFIFFVCVEKIFV